MLIGLDVVWDPHAEITACVLSGRGGGGREVVWWVSLSLSPLSSPSISLPSSLFLILFLPRSLALAIHPPCADVLPHHADPRGTLDRSS